MRPIYKIIIIFTLLALVAGAFMLFYCESVKFKIANNSGHTIDSLTLSNGTDSYRKYNIAPGEVIEDKLVFSGTVKSDGHYYVESYNKGQKQATGFGYFTNGSPTGKILVEITRDSIIAYEVANY